jgi:hypothetical protein
MLKTLQPSNKRVKSEKLKDIQPGDENVVCEKCGEVFTSGWALGGHASRVHPGESLSYKKKIQRRQER